MSGINQSMTSGVYRGDINRDATLGMIRAMMCDTFPAELSLKNLSKSAFATWIFDESNREGAALRAAMKPKAANRLNKNNPDGDRFTPDTVSREEMMQEFNTGQVVQLFLTAQAAALYGNDDKRILDAFFNVFQTRRISMGYLIGGKYFQVCSLRRTRNVTATEGADHASPSEILIYLHGIAFLDEKISNSDVRAKRWYKTGNVVGRVLHTIYKAYDRLTRGVPASITGIPLGSLGNAMSPYMLYNKITSRFEVLLTHDAGFAPAWHTKALFSSEHGDVQASNTAEEVGEPIHSRAPAVDKALRRLTSQFFDEFHALLENQAMYEKNDAELRLWAPYKKFLPRDSGLSLHFCDLDSQIAHPLEVTLPSPSTESTPIDVDADDDPSKVITPRRPPARQQTRKVKRKKTAPAFVQRTNVSRVSNVVPKVEDVIDDIVPASETFLSSEAKAAEEVLLQAMKPFCTIIRCGFEEVIDDLLQNEGMEVEGEVSLLLTDPPYNCRNEKDRPNSSYDVLTDEQMVLASEMASKLLAPGGHGHMFCSAYQFRFWVRSLDRITETFPDYNKDPTGRTTTEVPLFTIEPQPLTYVRTPGMYSSNPRHKRLQHMSVSDMAVHFWREGKPTSQMLNMVNYQAGGEVPSSLPGWTNVMTNLPRLEPKEVVYKQRESETQIGGSQKWRPEQKSIMLMKDLVSKFSSPGAVVMDTFCGTLSTAKACLSLHKHRKFVGCDIDSACIDASLPGLLLIFAKQCLNDDSDITVDYEVQEAAKLYISSMDAVEKKMRWTVWSVPGGFVPVQNFPEHILRFLSAMHFDYSLYDLCKMMGPHKWSRKWRQRLESSDMRALLAAESGALQLSVQPSSIKHPMAGRGLFSMRNIGAGETISYYYGSVVYSDLSGKPQKHRTYGEGVMAVTVQDFEKWAYKLDDRVVPVGGQSRTVWLVPAPFCVSRFMNDPRYLPGDKDGAQVREGVNREANVMFETSGSPSNPRDFEDHKILAVVATKNIVRGQEIFVNYGNAYDFGGSP